MGKNALIDVALELERIALSDEYFVSRGLYPNVDFYSGIIYKSLGFPTDMFPVLFCLPRMAGWLAHWIEQQDRFRLTQFMPRQLQMAPSTRHVYAAPEERSQSTTDEEEDDLALHPEVMVASPFEFRARSQSCFGRALRF